MQITLNGKPRTLAAATSIADLITQLRLDSRQVVIERNRQIVPHQRHASTTLQDGDQVEIVHFVGGG